MFRHFILFAVLCALPAAAHAEMAPFWETRRAQSIDLSTAACAGDADAYRELRMRAGGDRDPTALVSFAWLTTNSNCGAYFTGDEETATSFYREAAEGGYPLANGMMGMRLIVGRGTPPAPSRALPYIESALAGGYGDVGAYLAQEYITGRHLRRDEDAARRYLARAVEAGARQSLIDETRSMLEAEFATASHPAPRATMAEGRKACRKLWQSAVGCMQEACGPIEYSLPPAQEYCQLKVVDSLPKKVCKPNRNYSAEMATHTAWLECASAEGYECNWFALEEFMLAEGSGFDNGGCARSYVESVAAGSVPDWAE